MPSATTKVTAQTRAARIEECVFRKAVGTLLENLTFTHDEILATELLEDVARLVDPDALERELFNYDGRNGPEGDPAWEAAETRSIALAAAIFGRFASGEAQGYFLDESVRLAKLAADRLGDEAVA